LTDWDKIMEQIITGDKELVIETEQPKRIVNWLLDSIIFNHTQTHNQPLATIYGNQINNIYQAFTPTQPTVTAIATQQLAIEYHPQTIVENQPLINNQSDEEFNNTFTDANEEEEIIPLNAVRK